MTKKGHIHMENGEVIEFELFPNEAPNTVKTLRILQTQVFITT
jgi:peptidyl-prolyl cis-trans isomerase B (cyclophilin B)